MTVLSDINRRNLIGSFVAAGCLAGCGILTPSYTLHFRVTLYALINGIERTGSSVISGKWIDTLGAGDIGRWATEFVGDAIVINSSSAGMLLGLLSTMQGHPTGFNLNPDYLVSFVPNYHSIGNDKERFERLADLKGEHDLPESGWPILMYFSDLNKLQTARFVSPDDLSAGFGASSRITRFTFAVTDEPVTAGLADRLPWFDQIGKFHVDPAQPPETLPPFEQLEPRHIHANGAQL